MEPGINTQAPEPSGMEGALTSAPVASSSPGLAPVSDQERLAVIEGLLRLVELRPRVLHDPTVMLMLRLAVSGGGSGMVQAELDALREQASKVTSRASDTALELKHSQATTQDTQARLNDALASLDEALGDKAELQETVDELRKQVESGVGSDEAEAVRANLESSQALLATIEGLLVNPDLDLGKRPQATATKVQMALKSLRKVTSEAGSQADRVSELEDEVQQLRVKVVKAKGQKGAGTRKLGRKITDRLARHEFAARSQRYTFKGNGQKIPCCPSCGGLDPDKVDGDQAGHRKNCWFGNLTRELRDDIHKA